MDNVIKQLTFKDGKTAYTVGNIDIELNKQEPVEIEEIQVDENMFRKFEKNPAHVKFDKKSKKFSLK